jgi:hypothetical protein
VGDVVKQIAIPIHGSSVKVVYVKRILEIIEKMEFAQAEQDDDRDGD